MKHLELEPPFEVVKIYESYEFFTRDGVDLFLRFWKPYFFQISEIELKIKSKVSPGEFVKWESKIEEKHNEFHTIIEGLQDKTRSMLVSMDMDVDVVPIQKITAPVHTTKMEAFYKDLEGIDKTITYLDLLSISKQKQLYDRSAYIHEVIRRIKEILNLQRSVIEEYRVERRRARSVLRGKSKRFLPHV